MTDPIRLRPLASTDSLDAVTATLHRAYARLGAMGLNCTAVDQNVEMTRRRVASGHCIVAEDGAGIVGTITVNEGFDPNATPWARATPWFYRRDVAHFHQLGVEPEHQGRGLGQRLVEACEAWARERGLVAMALDTAVPAAHLRTRYEAMGYRDVGDVQWDGKRYRSVVMLKPLVGHVPTTSDPEHRCAVVRALWARVQARDWGAMRAALADRCTMSWPATRERFLDADAIVRVQGIYPEGWSIEIGDVLATLDGRVVSTVTVTHDEQTFLARSIFGFDTNACIADIDEVWATVEPAPAWRNAVAIGKCVRA